MFRWLVGVGAAVVAAVLLWAAFVRIQASTRPTEQMVLSHVHGLGVNPADGALFAATHYGTFRLTVGGDAERVGDSYQDTMGFTVVGPDMFLGSGHPDLPGLRSGQPPLLGLIFSRDAGDTWVPLSLRGKADFHGLVYSSGHVYGWNSTTGEFMVSSDRATWKTRSKLTLNSFAVDPTDPDHIVAATPRGLIASTDGGAIWHASPGPTLAILSWDAATGLWGADGSGQLWKQVEAEWKRAGSPSGEPQALLAKSGSLYLALTDREDRTAIYQSTDDGQTWRTLYQDPTDQTLAVP